MAINLLEVIKYNPSCIQNRALLRNILLDKYPQKIREINILLSVYDIGILRDIANNRIITEWQYRSYTQKLVSTYGLQEQLAIQGLNTWIDTFLGSGYSERFIVETKIENKNKVHTPDENINNYELARLSDTTAEIKKYVGNDERIDIPAEINHIKIVGISSRAFERRNNIKRIKISEGIKYIKEEAFQKCEDLEEVIIPSSVMELGANCFSDCKKLCSANLNEGLTTIGEHAFSHCKSLSEIIMPILLSFIKGQVR